MPVNMLLTFPTKFVGFLVINMDSLFTNLDRWQSFDKATLVRFVVIGIYNKICQNVMWSILVTFLTWFVIILVNSIF